jgi:acyl carrier protein
MNHQEVVATIIELLAPIAGNRVAVIDEQTGLTSELGLDSLQVMDLVVAIEDHFDISVPINALAELKTVGELALLIGNIAGQSA